MKSQRAARELLGDYDVGIKTANTSALLRWYSIISTSTVCRRRPGIRRAAGGKAQAASCGMMMLCRPQWPNSSLLARRPHPCRAGDAGVLFELPVPPPLLRWKMHATRRRPTRLLAFFVVDQRHPLQSSANRPGHYAARVPRQPVLSRRQRGRLREALLSNSSSQ